MAEAGERHTTTDQPGVWRRRLRWALVALFAFMAFESVLFAVALQGPWLVLLAPGIVCGVKAGEAYREASRVKTD